MGYTHYWTLKSENAPTSQEWADICEKVNLALDNTIVCREYDRQDEPPEINSNQIVFNGKGNDGHETFWLDPTDDGFQFCKTAKKPYDKFVVRSLQIAKDICPNWFQDLSSDGDGEDGKNIFS